MEFLRRWRQRDALDELREHMIAETESYLTECLRHPELAVRIPTIPAGSARFPATFCNAFWQPVLFE